MTNLAPSFGIFLRSVGERTTALAQEAAQAELLTGQLHVIANVTPAAQAFDAMFTKAQEQGYQWYLALDGDVVLQSGWLPRLQQQISHLDPVTTYNFSLPVVDYFGGVMDKGIHVYNGAFTKQAQDILRTQTWQTLKPESTIKRWLPSAQSIYLADEPPIGWHGFEQYYADVYYRFFLQSVRSQAVSRRYAFLFKGVAQSSADHDIARAGYQAGRQLHNRPWVRRLLGLQSHASDASLRHTIRVQLTKNGVAEKEALTITLEEFRQQYQRYVKTTETARSR